MIPWRRERLPTPLFWPGEFQGLAESDTTEWLSFSLSFRPSRAECFMLLLSSRSVMSDSLWPRGLHYGRLPCPSPPPELIQTHVHRVGDAIQPSHPLPPFLLLPSNFLSIRVFSNESALGISWPKYWSFSFIISPSSEFSGLISFRIDSFRLISLLSKGLSRAFSSTTVQKHQFFGTQPF